jgi:hypothetical protein
LPLSRGGIDKLKCVFSSEENASSKSAVRRLISFASTCLRENEFSNYTATDTKYRKRLNEDARFNNGTI